MYTLTINDVEFKDGEIIKYKNKVETEIIIPNHFNNIPVTRIGHCAFIFSNLTNVILPNTLKEIGNEAFNCNDIKSIIIPDSVTKILSYAFDDNDNITEIKWNNVLYKVKSFDGLVSIIDEEKTININGNDIIVYTCRDFGGFFDKHYIAESIKHKIHTLSYSDSEIAVVEALEQEIKDMSR